MKTKNSYAYDHIEFMKEVKRISLEDLINANIIMAKAQLINDIVWAFRKAIILRKFGKEDWKEFWNLGIQRLRNFDRNLKEFEQVIKKLANFIGMT